MLLYEIPTIGKIVVIMYPRFIASIAMLDLLQDHHSTAWEMRLDYIQESSNVLRPIKLILVLSRLDTIVHFLLMSMFILLMPNR